MFSVEERVQMLNDVVRMITGEEAPTLLNPMSSVEVSSFEGIYLVNYAHRIGATHLLRGIRSAEDFGFENAIRHINEDIDPRIETVYLIPPRHLCEVSSSTVKGLIGPAGWRDVVKKLVPPPVFACLTERFGDG